MSTQKPIRYVDTFAGYGGFSLGIQRAFSDSGLVSPRGQIDTVSGRQEAEHSAGVGHSQAERNPDGAINSTSPICIGFSEVNKYAIQVYQKHFPKHFNHGDITKINPAELPDFDLLTGGFPCQAFSIAGKRQGFNDTRGTLFFDIARILKEKRPRNFILENVKGLLSHDNGRTFKTIITTLVELGYCVEWQVLNAKDYVPQNRERVFLVGHFGGVPERKVFPIGESHKKDIIQLNNPTHSNNRLYGEKGVSPSLNTAQGGNRQPKIINPKMLNYVGSSKESVAITATSYKEPPVVMGAKIRRLTPKECERLMGLPDQVFSAKLNLCLDQVESYVDAVRRNPKLLELVSGVESGELKELADFVSELLKQKNLQIKSFVQESVSLQTTTGKSTSVIKPELSSSVNGAETKPKCQHQSGEEGIAPLNVFIGTTEGRITSVGKEELHQSEQQQTVRRDGVGAVELCGDEIMRLAGDAESVSDIGSIKHSTFTISDRFAIKSLDMSLVILYFFAAAVIDGFTQKRIPKKDISLSLEMITGWTEGQSDSQRYKLCGNGVVVNVVEAIVRKLYGLCPTSHSNTVDS